MKLQELRKIKGLTQKEAAELLNIPLRTYKRYELEEVDKNSFKYHQIYSELAKIPVKTSQKTNNKLKIGIIGIGYVGLSLGSLLSLEHDVIAFDIDESKIEKVNNRECYLKDKLLEKVFKDKKFSLKALSVKNEYFKDRDVIIIATNTDFNIETGEFDTNSVDQSIELIRSVNKKCLIVIKSTIPMGYVDSKNDDRLIFSPEFLSEGNAVHDILYPSRIIVGANKITPDVKKFGKCLSNLSFNNRNVIYMTPIEAEAVKLFSNAYLAMRVAYFNELDTYAETKGLNPLNIIKGVSLDPRIGDYYNNPSFGYGGYCLPKDTAQLKRSFLNIKNNNIIQAIIESNHTRKEFIVSQIEKKINNKDEEVIGVYRLSMKKDSDNWRNSSILDILDSLKNKGYHLVIYEPNYKGELSSVSFDELINKSSIIIANRFDKKLEPFANKVYTRDLLGIN